MTRKYKWTAALLFAVCGALFAHEGHDKPDVLPPVGPHGGKYSKMGNHFAEVTVSGDMAMIYILEDDVKSAPANLGEVTAAIEIPGKGKTNLSLARMDGGMFHASVSIPKNARRVYFHVNARVNGKAESAKILYEPK